MGESKPPQAIDQMVSYFAVVHDPRRQHPTTLHSHEAMWTVTRPATRCGAHNWEESEPWGQAHAPWLSALLDLTHSIPAPDTVAGALLYSSQPSSSRPFCRGCARRRGPMAPARECGDA